MSVHVFVGSTLPAEQVLDIRPDAVAEPPIAHGDLLRLKLGPNDTAVVVDGYYHQRPAVRHKEILAVLARGTRVVGCSSMGALRAAELYPLGMIGHGVVFDLYRDGVIDGDDEVAITHTEAPEYQALSLPLVNIRHAVAAAAGAGVLTPQQANVVVDVVRSLHYTDRVWPAIQQAARTDDDRFAIAALRAFLRDCPTFGDVKATDAVDALTHLDELCATGSMEWVSSSDWRSRFLYDWDVSFAEDTVSGIRIGLAAVATYQQLHHPDFPQRWRSFVSARVSPGSDTVTSVRILAAARDHGVRAESLSADRLRYWLTQDECDRLPWPDKVLLAITRSYRPPRMSGDLVDAAADLVTDPAARTAVAESHLVNAEIAAKRPEFGPHRIKATTLRAHLARTWGAVDDEELLAAARDRGFEDVEAAITALRPFFLRQQFRAAVPQRRVIT